MRAHDLDLLTHAVRTAGEIARGYFEGANTVWQKDGAGPVTDADIAVNTHLHDTLRSARPDYGWLSEETEDDSSRLSTTRQFVIDPIDGTRAFVAGEKTWAHSVAVVEKGRAVAGVVYLPMKDRLYAATLGGGATLNGRPLRNSGRPGAGGARILAARTTFDAAHWKSVPPAVKRHFRPSIAYRLSLVAEGAFDGMLTLRDSWEWDIAAGSLIATEAGARVSDRHGAPLLFNAPHPAAPGVVVAAPGVHADLIHALLGPGTAG